MNEGAPKELTEKEVFKALKRKLGPYVNLDQRYPAEFKASVTNTMTAHNLISEFVDDGQPIPESWDNINLTPQTKFTFVKETDGKLYKKDNSFISPKAFMKAMKKFHDLEDLISTEEKKTIEDEKERAAAAQKKLEEDAKSGALWRNRMQNPVATQNENSVKPVRPSAFRPRG